MKKALIACMALMMVGASSFAAPKHIAAKHAVTHSGHKKSKKSKKAKKHHHYKGPKSTAVKTHTLPM